MILYNTKVAGKVHAHRGNGFDLSPITHGHSTLRGVVYRFRGEISHDHHCEVEASDLYICDPYVSPYRGMCGRHHPDLFGPPIQPVRMDPGVSGNGDYHPIAAVNEV